MPKSFTDLFNISKNEFEKTGALDVVLDMDARFFVDPALLRSCTISEFLQAEKIITEYFRKIIVLISHSKTKGDMFWNKADELLCFKEMRETCLGYSDKGTAGNAIGDVLRENILVTISELLKAGEL